MYSSSDRISQQPPDATIANVYEFIGKCLQRTPDRR